MIYIAGLHIDISPLPGQVFPLTKFVPCAAFMQGADGSQQIIEQQVLYELLKKQSVENVNQVDLDEAINVMAHAEKIKVLS